MKKVLVIRAITAFQNIGMSNKTTIIQNPELYKTESLGVSKPI